MSQYIFLSQPFRGAQYYPQELVAQSFDIMAEPKRISIHSLLNNHSEEPDPMTSSGSFGDEKQTHSTHHDLQTPATTTSSPFQSPAMSQSPAISTSSLRMHQAPSRRDSASSGSSETIRLERRKSPVHHPYEESQRSRTGRGSRQFRPSYEDEEAYFIWYHRIDLELEWAQITVRFNNYFKQKRTGCQGFQCKFYRFLQEFEIPPVRQRSKLPDPEQWHLTNFKPELKDVYPWMRPGATDPPPRR